MAGDTLHREPSSCLERLLAGAEVEWRTLGEVCDISRGVRVVRRQLQAVGAYPVYQNALTPLGYFDRYNCPAGTVFVIAAGAAGQIGYSEEAFWAADDCFHFHCHEGLVGRFLYHWLLDRQMYLTSQVRKAAVPRLPRLALEELVVPLPPLAVQMKIAEILDAFTASEAELEHELTRELSARRKQYAYYRDRLLSFEGEDVEWKTLGEVCMTTEKVRWSTKAGQRFLYIDLAAVDLITGRISALQEIDAESAPSRAQQVMRYEDVLFGLTRPTLGRCGLVPSHLDGQICSTGFCVLRADVAQVLPRYLFHSLKTAAFNGYVRENQEGTTYPAISSNAVKAYRLPIPPLARQAEIAEVMDRLHALGLSLVYELPAELQARRRQYEHYREQLLSFPGANSPQAAS